MRHLLDYTGNYISSSVLVCISGCTVTLSGQKRYDEDEVPLPRL